ncbi:MAG: RNA methyltransferase, partial [Betaproteobacteria bacterium]|nr:RNA methyltransferase [Betaproteobacteria bacterium]
MSPPEKKKRVSSGGETIVVSGARAVWAMLAEGRARRIWTDEKNRRVPEIIKKARQDGVEIISAEKLDAAQGISAEVLPPPAVWKTLLALPKKPSLVVLDGVTDPRNLGAVMRAARAFSAAGVVVGGRRSAPLSAAAVKASAGAAAFLPLYRVVNLRRALLELRAAGWFLAGADEKAELSIPDAELPPPVCWVLGDEGGGMRRLTKETCDVLARIPAAAGDAGCLNVAAACAVCLALGGQKDFAKAA